MYVEEEGRTVPASEELDGPNSMDLMAHATSCTCSAKASACCEEPATAADI